MASYDTNEVWKLPYSRVSVKVSVIDWGSEAHVTRQDRSNIATGLCIAAWAHRKIVQSISPSVFLWAMLATMTLAVVVCVCHEHGSEYGERIDRSMIFGQECLSFNSQQFILHSLV